jgi:hypothetical protein
MGIRVPIGICESQRLEFVDKKTLEDPQKIAREIVGMLNQEGGEIWIGIGGDSDGVGSELQNIEEVDREVSRLLDVVLDRIEPAPLSAEVIIDKQGTEKRNVIRIRVEPILERRPYALLQQAGRHFVRRLGADNLYLSRFELEQLFSSSRIPSSEQPAWKLRIEDLIKDRASLIAQKPSSLWLRIVPVESVELVEKGRERLERLLRDPALSNNRRTGWNFTSRFHEPESDHDGLVTRRGDATEVRVRRHGEIRFRVTLIGCSWADRIGGRWPVGTDPHRTFYSTSLIEYPVSVFRLAAEIFGDDMVFQPLMQDDSIFLIDFFVTGLDGWLLRPHDPEEISSAITEPHESHRGSILTLEEPLRITAGELQSNPDRQGLRILRYFYRSFGFTESDIPRYFDQDTGRLKLPEYVAE